MWTLAGLDMLISTYQQGIVNWVVSVCCIALPYVIMWLLPRTKRAKRAKEMKIAQKQLEQLSNSINRLNTVLHSPEKAFKITSHQINEPPTAKVKPVPGVSYIEDEKGNIIARTDGKEISDEEIPYLIQLGYERALQAEENSSNPKFHRTMQEKELCFQFMMNHGREIHKHTFSFQEARRMAHDEKDLNIKIELLQKVIEIFELERNWFYRTKGGMLFFQDYYEHLHNSRNEDFSYIDSVKDYLEYCIHKRDYVIPEIMRLITSQDGIFQKDIYKYLPDEPRADIQNTIRELADDKRINRTKRGNSYFLTLL